MANLPRPAAPKPPTAPHAPTAPTVDGPARKRSSRFGKRSKTGNSRCSEAASAWQLALRAGRHPGADVYKTLAQCRAANRTAKQAQAAVASGRMSSAAGKGLAARAKGDRVNRSLATATARKAELRARLRERAGRTISQADRDKAHAIASRVTGNNTVGGSAALRRLQGVRSGRSSNSTTPARTRAPRARQTAQTTRKPITDNSIIGRHADHPVGNTITRSVKPSAMDKLRAATERNREGRMGHARERRLAASGYRLMREQGEAGRQAARRLRREAHSEVRRRYGSQDDNGDARQTLQHLAAYHVEANFHRHFNAIPRPELVGPRVPSIGLDAMRARQEQRGYQGPDAAAQRVRAARALANLRSQGATGRSEARSIRGAARVANLADSSRAAYANRGYRVLEELGRRGNNANMQAEAMAANVRDRFYQGGLANDSDVLTGATNDPRVLQRRAQAADILARHRMYRRATEAARGQRMSSRIIRENISTIQAGKPIRHSVSLAGQTEPVSISGRNRQARSNLLGDYTRGYDRRVAQQAAAQRTAATAATPPPAPAPTPAPAAAPAGGGRAVSTTGRSRGSRYWDNYFEQRRALPGMADFRAPVSTQAARGGGRASDAVIRSRERARDVALGITARVGTREYHQQVARAEHAYKQQRGLNHPHQNRDLANAAASGRLGGTQASRPTTSGAQYQPPSAAGVVRPVHRHGRGSSYTDDQIVQARQQAGQFGDYAAQSRHSPQERQRAVDQAADLGLLLSGNTRDEKFNHLASILGAPVEAARHIRVTPGSGHIRLTNEHNNAGGHTRTISIDHDGRPYIYNDYYIPNDTGRRAGMATDHYNRQILAARAAGIQRVRVSGAGYGQGNTDTSRQSATGYHTWLEYGFDGPMPPNHAQVIRNAHPALANAVNYSEGIHHPDPVVRQAARDAFRARGSGTSRVALEIADHSSPSMVNYRNLWERRRGTAWKQSNVNTQASRAGNYDIYR